MQIFTNRSWFLCRSGLCHIVIHQIAILWLFVTWNISVQGLTSNRFNKNDFKYDNMSTVVSKVSNIIRGHLKSIYTTVDELNWNIRPRYHLWINSYFIWLKYVFFLFCIKDSVETSLKIIHDIATENIGTLCVTKSKSYSSLKIQLNTQRYDGSRQKADLAAVVLQDVGFIRHGGEFTVIIPKLLCKEYAHAHWLWMVIE